MRVSRMESTDRLERGTVHVLIEGYTRDDVVKEMKRLSLLTDTSDVEFLEPWWDYQDRYSNRPPRLVWQTHGRMK